MAHTENTQTKRSSYLAGIVKGKPEEEDVREGLNDAEEPIHNPVSQPLCVVILIVALDGFDAERTGQVGGRRSMRSQCEQHIKKCNVTVRCSFEDTHLLHRTTKRPQMRKKSLMTTKCPCYIYL